MINAGQDCTAATRAYVQRPLYDAFVDAGRRADGRGPARRPVDDPDTDMGSLISTAHRETGRRRWSSAPTKPAPRVVCGGRIPPKDRPTGGAYYAPTLIADAAQDSEIVQDEVFGPVLVALPFDTDDEAIELANDTPYGLAASAWTTNVYRAQRATRRSRRAAYGSTTTSRSSPRCRTAATRPPASARTCRTYSFEEYTNVKHVMSDITGNAHKGWHDTIFGGE